MSGSGLATSYYYPVDENDETSGQAKPAYVADELSVMELPAVYRDDVKAAQVNRLQEWSQRRLAVGRKPAAMETLMEHEELLTNQQPQPIGEEANVSIPAPITSSYYPDQTLPLAYTLDYRMVSTTPGGAANSIMACPIAVPMMQTTSAPVHQNNALQYQAQQIPLQPAYPMTNTLPSLSYMPIPNQAPMTDNLVEAAPHSVKTVLPELKNAYAPDESGYAWEREDQKKADGKEQTVTAHVEQNYANKFYEAPTAARKQDGSIYYDVPNTLQYAFAQNELPLSYRMVNNYSTASALAPVHYNANKNVDAPVSSYQFAADACVPKPSTPVEEIPMKKSRLVNPIVATSPVNQLANKQSHDMELPSPLGLAFSPVGLAPMSEYKNEFLNDLVSCIKH